MKRLILLAMAVILTFAIPASGKATFVKSLQVDSCLERIQSNTPGEEAVKGKSGEVQDVKVKNLSEDTLSQPAKGDGFRPVPGGNALIQFAFAGDVLLDGFCADIIERKGMDYLFSEVRAILEEADLAAANLETPISSRGVKAEDKQFTFRAKPEYVKALTASGIDVFSLANNHILDFGQEAMLDTFRYLGENSIPYAGAGENLDSASRPAYLTRKGANIAFLASSHVIPYTSWAAEAARPGVAVTYNPDRLKREIAEAKKQVDIVIVYTHWGEEGSEITAQYQRNLARIYIDEGADIVVGSHPHVLQGFEFYKGKIIAYSLGNFVFTDMQKDTAILQVKASKGSIEEVKVIPCEIIDCKPYPLKEGEERQRRLKKLEQLSYGVSIDGTGRIREVQP